jgi:hypothetical protein
MLLHVQTSVHEVRRDVDFAALCAAVAPKVLACGKPILMTTPPGADGSDSPTICFRSLDVDGIPAAVSIFWTVRVLSSCTVTLGVPLFPAPRSQSTSCQVTVPNSYAHVPSGTCSPATHPPTPAPPPPHTHTQEYHKLTVEQFTIKKPEYWDDRVTAPGTRLPVAKDSPEWAMVLSKFHVGGFTKAVHSIERVQVGSSTTPQLWWWRLRPTCLCGRAVRGRALRAILCCAVMRQNEDLWDKYYQERRDLEKRTSLPLGNEMWLLHGTSSTKPDEICRTGFDFRCGVCHTAALLSPRFL